MIRYILGGLIILLSACTPYPYNSHAKYDRNAPSSYDVYKEKQLRDAQLRYYKRENMK